MQKFHMKPSVLEAKGIKVHRVVQNAGDFIVTFPGRLLYKLWLLLTLTAGHYFVAKVHTT